MWGLSDIRTGQGVRSSRVITCPYIPYMLPESSSVFQTSNCDPLVSYKEKAWYPTPVLLPGKSHGWRSLVGCCLWGCTESDTTERLHIHFSLSHWRRKWQPTPVFLPGESQGRGSLVGCCLWGRTESDTTEAT